MGEGVGEMEGACAVDKAEEDGEEKYFTEIKRGGRRECWNW
jgi:hypothetical protein